MKEHCDYCKDTERHVSEHEGFILCPTCLGSQRFVLPVLRRMRLVTNIIMGSFIVIMLMTGAIFLAIMRRL